MMGCCAPDEQVLLTKQRAYAGRHSTIWPQRHTCVENGSRPRSIMEEDVRQTLRSGLPNAGVKIFDGLGH